MASWVWGVAMAPLWQEGNPLVRPPFSGGPTEIEGFISPSIAKAREMRRGGGQQDPCAQRLPALEVLKVPSAEAGCPPAQGGIEVRHTLPLLLAHLQ